MNFWPHRGRNVAAKLCAIFASLIWLSCLLVLGLGNIAQAQTTSKDFVEVLGLTLPCKSCRTKKDPCLLAVGGDTKFRDCTGPVLIILNKLKKRDYTGENPSLGEIRNYLYSDEANPEISASLIYLMAQVEPGVRLLLGDADFLLEEYEPPIAQVILQGKADPLFAKGLWVKAKSGANTFSSETLASVAASNPDISVAALFEILKNRDDKSLGELAKIEYVYRRLGQLVLADKLHEAIVAIEECGEGLGNCAELDFDNFDKPVSVYLQEVREKFYVNTATVKIENNPLEIIEQIKQVAGKTSFSEQGQSLIINALTNALDESSAATRSSLVEESNLGLLRATAEQSKGVARALATVLVKVSDEAIKNANPSRCLQMLEVSLDVYPSVLESRSRLIIDLHSHPLIQDNMKLLERFEKALRPENRRKKAKSVERKILPVKILFVFVGIAGVLWVLTLFSYYRKQSREVVEEKEAKLELAVWKRERDKRQLRAYFSLDEDSTEDDLIYTYRKMAKSIHPDTSDGETEAQFRELADMFEQARRILYKKK